MAEQEFFVKFWGVRGSIACPGPNYARYGGNTSCLEVVCGPHQMVFDAGTGIRPLGQELVKVRPNDLDIFFTHTHFDHICGLTFFSSLFCADSKVRLWSGHLQPQGMSLKNVLAGMMAAPLYPVSLEIFQAQVGFEDFNAGQVLTPKPGVSLRTAPLNHPNGATGYRIDYAGKSICYITDTEHVEGKPDRTIIDLVQGAEVMIYDSTYSDAEYPTYKGWGHSTWQEGIRLANLANVGKLVIFHHDPSHDDRAMDEIERAAERARPGGVQVAREGAVLRP